MKNNSWIQWVLLLSFCCSLSSSIAQGWERTYNNALFEKGYDIQLTNDSSYFVSGEINDNFYALKIDMHGDTIWTKSHSSGHPSTAYFGFQTSDGNYLLGGDVKISNSGDFYLLKLDTNGNTIWTKTHQVTGNASTKEGQQTIDGGYILAGLDHNDAYVIKTDSLGNALWTRTYGDSILREAFRSVEQTTDSGYIFTGVAVSASYRSSIYLVKTDINGDTLWTKNHDINSSNNMGMHVSQTSDDGYILVCTNGISCGWGALIVKTNALGDTIWTKSFDSNFYSIEETNDGNYIIGGSDYYGYNSLLKISATGSVLWQRRYAKGTGFQVRQTADGGYILCGYTYLNNNSGTDLYIVKTDSMGISLSNYIRGNVFQDNNNNCVLDTGDIDLSGVLITATNSNGQVYYTTTDALGYYNILCELGNYTIHASNIGAYYNTTCGQNISTTLSNPFEIDTVNFALDPNILCPLLLVDLSTPFIRPTGGGGVYTVHYCNHGTIEAQNAYVEVEFDPNLIILATGLPISNQNNNIYTFSLGNLAVGQCASFNVSVLADSNSIMGQTFCSEAHIYPDSICTPNLWNGPILDADAVCINDTVHFELRNIGNPMLQSSAYFVYEDNIIFRTGNTNVLGTFGTQTIQVAAAAGKTYRISVQQASGFPAILGDSVATTSVEGCNPNANGSFNTGFITQFSNGNSAPFIAVDCQQMIGSYDPNDKSAQPEGYGPQHYIEAHTGLDYKIRFQNTGTDTAFSVVLIDTISPYLDLSSIEMGASSHPYTWRIYGQRILEIKFSPIALPDSTTNEFASHGFVRFRINQVNNNPIGTRIENTVGIYFDYNAPVITNTTWHTIGEDFTPIFLSIDPVHTPNLNVRVFPNPFNQATNIEVEGASYETLTLSVFDATGRLVYNRQTSGNRIELLRGNLTEGLYFYRLEGDLELLNTGKLVVRN